VSDAEVAAAFGRAGPNPRREIMALY
jgi:hypothetical protein